ncbi:hypothetical protein FB451DRAFT_1461281, partial [Mycena latifolia]
RGCTFQIRECLVRNPRAKSQRLLGENEDGVRLCLSISIFHFGRVHPSEAKPWKYTVSTMMHTDSLLLRNSPPVSSKACLSASINAYRGGWIFLEDCCDLFTRLICCGLCTRLSEFEFLVLLIHHGGRHTAGRTSTRCKRLRLVCVFATTTLGVRIRCGDEVQEMRRAGGAPPASRPAAPPTHGGPSSLGCSAAAPRRCGACRDSVWVGFLACGDVISCGLCPRSLGIARPFDELRGGVMSCRAARSRAGWCGAKSRLLPRSSLRCAARDAHMSSVSCASARSGRGALCPVPLPVVSCGAERGQGGGLRALVRGVESRCRCRCALLPDVVFVRAASSGDGGTRRAYRLAFLSKFPPGHACGGVLPMGFLRTDEH